MNQTKTNYNIDLSIESKEKQKPEKLKRTIKDKLEEHVRDEVINEVKMVSKVERVDINE